MDLTNQPTILRTVTGDIPIEQLGLILPHEHLFTDLRGPETPGYAQGDPQEVAEAMLPLLAEAQTEGVSALVECSTVGVGRNITVLRYLAERTPVRIVAPTGVYREAYIPRAMLETSAEALAEAWAEELTVGIESSGIKAGFIKIAVSDDGITQRESRNLQAAAHASQATGAAVASHTIFGSVAHLEMDLLEKHGMDLRRFIWVHAHAESTHADRLEAARRGAWIELDAIGAPWLGTDTIQRATLDLLEAGFASQILLSHDAGWYQPGNPGGNPGTSPQDGMRGYTALTRSFLPQLQALGVNEATLRMLTEANPKKAFGITLI